MSPRLLRVALTGGIATGKSHCLSKFAQLGVPVIDADAIARRVVQPGTAGLDAVANRFGPSVLRSNGELDRAALAGAVFADPAARAHLEAIIHPAVYEAIDRWFSSDVPRLLDSQPPSRPASQPSILNASGATLSAIADLPLLYETCRERDFGCVIAATCRPEQQLQRLLLRGLSETEARQRIESQLPIGEKAARADYLIDTSGTLAETDRQVEEVYERLRDR